MENENKPVETKVEVAGTTTEAVVTPPTTEVDYEAELAKKDAVIAQIQGEKENYRKGMLKAKGKLPEEDQADAELPEDIDAKIDRKVAERLLSTKEAQAQAEKDEIIKKALKRNKELELALKNRGQVTSTSGQGSNQEKPEGKTDNYFSNEQLSALKAKGYDDKKIAELKKNISKVNEMPR